MFNLAFSWLDIQGKSLHNLKGVGIYTNLQKKQVMIKFSSEGKVYEILKFTALMFEISEGDEVDYSRVEKILKHNSDTAIRRAKE